MIFILVALFFVLALRGPPLDENLLLSNIATANKKVEHLTEVTQCLLRSCLVRIVLWITTRMVVLRNILSCFWNRRWFLVRVLDVVNMHRFQTSRKRYCLWWKSIRQWWSRGYGRGVDQKWITCLTSIFAPFVSIVTSSFLISPLEHSLRASAVMCTLQNVFIRCSFVDCCHWICVDRKPMRKESPFSRTVILRIVFYEIRKTGNGSLFFRCIL